MCIPVARFEPRNTGERVTATMARVRSRANRIATNRVTRGWFVGGIGGGISVLHLSPLIGAIWSAVMVFFAAIFFYAFYGAATYFREMDS